ncbi:SDR family oxidoreductase [Sulfurospirillum oryzae]|uniref:SDR family oxidoreductase n=1 Tax=Sulfurospirillum oryzae TaxID=2976535 RepID=UPI0021E87284|nr:SDR family NAD(P)-dependent oxidoreductase [Sulfurospirillum oryzae]
MNMTHNTILITGGTSGIGYELARQLCESNTVIITGRNQEKLDQAKANLKNVHTFQCDVANPQEIINLHQAVTTQFPALNIVVNNAGIMKKIDLQQEVDLLTLTQEIDINVNGVLRMCTQFLPHLKQQKNAAIINVSSALAFVPFVSTPVYCATKAALHSYTQSLRVQLRNTKVKIFELAPPAIETPLINEFDASEQESMSIMNVTKLAKLAIEGIKSDEEEIRPGQSNLLKMMSRIAPSFALNMLNKAYISTHS